MNKKNKFILFVLLLSWFSIPTNLIAQGLDEETILFKIADNIIDSRNFELMDISNNKIYKSVKEIDSSAILRIVSPYNDWRYWNGVINIGFLTLSEESNRAEYKNFVENNFEFAFDNFHHFQELHKDENKWSYNFGQLFIMEELDDCGAMGASLIELYKNNKQKRYKEYLAKAAKHISFIQHRLDDQTLVRSFPKEWTIWADDLYMSISFISRYGELTGDTSYFNDAARQVNNFNKYLFDEKYGLMYHNWYSDEQTRGIAFWGRANGWAILAQTDLLERLPESFSQKDTLLKLYKRHIDGLIKYQSKSGLWHQLINKTDSYQETSCSAMFTYSIAKGVNMGILDSTYTEFAKLGWEGIKTKITEDGLIEGVCAGTIVYDELKPYYDRPTPLNDIHGIGAVILAGTEILKLNKNNK